MALVGHDLARNLDVRVQLALQKAFGCMLVLPVRLPDIELGNVSRYDAAPGYLPGRSSATEYSGSTNNHARYDA
jgi:hypothetical protein